MSSVTTTEARERAIRVLLAIAEDETVLTTPEQRIAAARVLLDFAPS